MTKEDNISPMRSDFEQIKKHREDGREYWTSRDLCTTLGYSTYQKFTRLLTKAIAIANAKGMNVADHFNQTVEMVKLGSGTFRKVENMHLSRMACLIIAENADGKKLQVQMAREYFKQEVSTTELMVNNLSSNILLYKTKQGEARIEVVFNNETFWMSQKRMAVLYGVEVPTINYHLSQIYESGELTEQATIRKIPIVQMEGNREVNRLQMLYNLDAMHWAVTHQTAAEIIYTRADAEMPHMGLTTWKNAPDGRVQKSDTIVAKNYLSDKEVDALNRLSTAFLDMAELRAQRQIVATMADWKKQLDDFLNLYGYNKLNDAGTISTEQAKEKAYAEYDKFRIIQDKEYLSDFDKEIKIWKEKGLFEKD